MKNIKLQGKLQKFLIKRLNQKLKNIKRIKGMNNNGYTPDLVKTFLM